MDDAEVYDAYGCCSIAGHNTLDIAMTTGLLPAVPRTAGRWVSASANDSPSHHHPGGQQLPFAAQLHPVGQ